MTSDRIPHAGPIDPHVALALVLEQSEEVTAKVESCADDLGSANDVTKKKMAEGATHLSARGTLAASEKLKSKVDECADDLHDVNKALAQGVDERRGTETVLMKTRQTLADTEAALVLAREEVKRAQQRALHDATTGLPNRALFDDRLAQAIFGVERHGGTLAVMFLDLDSFKAINDTHGHATGDSVLKEIAQRLSRHSRDEDAVCRNGGDEFLYLLVNPRGSVNIERIARAVLMEIARPIDIASVHLVIESSIGIAVYPEDGMTGKQLIENADTAMYRAKKRDGRCAFFGALD